MSDQPGKRVGDYEILDELGRGGMGRVYRVRHVITDRIEAMKILLPELAGREELVARFLREIKLLASLNHPNIGALRTALTADDQLVMIMEFVEGTTLEERLEQGPLPVAEALDCTEQVLKALSYAHQRGVVHRDIKPANMMLTHDGVIKVMDFGVAFVGTEQKLTSTGTTIGSLPYMSPEQVRGESADPRSDLYSLGVSLYEMVTGRRPFSADSDFAIMIAHVKEAPRPPIELQPGLPERLNAVILHALAKEKENRFQSADEFREALKGMAAPEKTAVFTPAFPIPAAVRSSETVHSHPMVAAPPAPAPAVTAAPAPAPVAAAPVAAPVVQAPSRSSYRGLYMALGGVLAVVVLLAAVVVAGMYYRSKAAGSSADQPAAVPAAVETPAAVPGSKPAAEPAQRPGAAPAVQKAPASQPDPAVLAEEQRKALEAAALEAERQAALAELEKRLDNLTARAFAVDSSLETMRAQQQRAGYDLRGDVATNWASMKFALKRAQDAWEKGDPLNGKKYADQAENHLRQLEKFLGR